MSIVDFPNGDASAALARLAVKGLRENGSTACLLVPHASQLGEDAGNERAIGHSDGVPYLYANGRTNRPRSVLGALADSIKGMLVTATVIIRRRRVSEPQAVVLYTPDALEFLPLILVCLFCGVPLFVWTTELMSAAKSNSWKHGIRKVGHILTERVLPRFAHGYIVISTRLQAHYQQYIRKESILHVPILMEESSHKCSSLGVGHSPSVIYYGGTFGGKDGVLYIIRAFKLLHEKYPNTVLMMSGRSPNEGVMNEVYQLVRQNGLANAVQFKGFLRRDELMDLFQQVDIAIVCRTMDDMAQYGFPWKMGEYFATGKPIVATRVGDVECYFENGKDLWIAEPENPYSIAQMMEQVLVDYEKSLTIAEHGRQTALKVFDYKVQTRHVADFIRRQLYSH